MNLSLLKITFKGEEGENRFDKGMGNVGMGMGVNQVLQQYPFLSNNTDWGYFENGIEKHLETKGVGGFLFFFFFLFILHKSK